MAPKEVDKVKEIQHVEKASRANNNPDWTLRIPSTGSGSRESEQPVNEKRIYASVPYIKSTSERLQRAFKSHEVTLVYKPFNSLRSLLVRVKDKTENTITNNVTRTMSHIYYEQYDKEYVGETSRSSETRVEEHCSSRNSSADHERCQLTEHLVDSCHGK